MSGCAALPKALPPQATDVVVSSHIEAISGRWLAVAAVLSVSGDRGHRVSPTPCLCLSASTSAFVLAPTEC